MVLKATSPRKFKAGQIVFFRHWYNGQPIKCKVKSYIRVLQSYLVEISEVYNKQENELYATEQEARAAASKERRS